MKITREIKTALIAIGILLGTIWGYNFLKGKNILSPSSEYFVVYDQIEGLIESGAVYYKGYQVGNISEIMFNSNKPDKFVLSIVLKKELKLPLGTKIVAKETNLIAGAKDLQLLFSDSKEYHTPGDTLLPAYDSGMLGILEPIQGQLESVMINLNQTLSSINNILSTEMQKDLNESIASLNRMFANLANSTSTNGTLGKSLQNVETITGSLAENSESMGAALVNLESITTDLDSANIDQTLLKLDSTMSSINSIMAKIDNAEGSAGLIVNDSSLYINLASATASLDSLLVDLKENPNRYVHVSVFGGKNKDK